MLVHAEVRCCCAPGKLLGHLDVEDSYLRHKYFNIPIMVEGEIASLQLDVGVIDDNRGNRYRAFQAHESDLPILRKMPVFVEYGSRWTWAQFHDEGFEVSSAGNTMYSPLFARLADGRTIEEAYQLDVKGWRATGISQWRDAKGKRPLISVDLLAEYTNLWKQWARENPGAITRLARRSRGMVLTDRHATSPVNQAHALAVILNDTYRVSGH